MKQTIYVESRNGEMSNGFYAFEWDNMSYYLVKNLVREVFSSRGKSYDICVVPCSKISSQVTLETLHGIGEILEWANDYVLYKEETIFDFQIERSLLTNVVFSTINHDIVLKCLTIKRDGGKYWENRLSGYIKDNVMLRLDTLEVAKKLKPILQKYSLMGEGNIYSEENFEKFYTQKAGIEIKKVDYNKFSIYKLEYKQYKIGVKLVAVD